MKGTTADAASQHLSDSVTKASSVGARTLPHVVALAVLAPQGSAKTQEAGTFQIVNSCVRNYGTIEHADGTFTGGALSGTVTIVESGGLPFGAGGTGIVECLVFARSTKSGATDLEAPCTANDEARGELHFLAGRRCGVWPQGLRLSRDHGRHRQTCRRVGRVSLRDALPS